MTDSTGIKSLSVTLSSIRKEKGMSLREFSEYLGISHTYLNKLEKGIDVRTGKDVTPTIDTLAKISDGLNIPIKQFMDMCGYFDIDIGYLDDSGNSPKTNIDITDFTKEVCERLLTADKVTFNGKALNKPELDIIIGAIQVGVELALKDKSNIRKGL